MPSLDHDRNTIHTLLMTNTNPRCDAWLRAHGLTYADIKRERGKGIPRVTIDGECTLWTVHFMRWVQAQWRAWGTMLGFDGVRPHHNALANGHTEGDFDQWLADS